MVNLIKAVISTLNGVEVKGKANLDAMLGSINALEAVVQVMEQAPAKEPSATGVNSTPPDAGAKDVDMQEVANG